MRLDPTFANSCLTDLSKNKFYKYHYFPVYFQFNFQDKNGVCFRLFIYDLFFVTALSYIKKFFRQTSNIYPFYFK